ncbi:hypothetical protein IWQ60_000021 [Tieghemiomyces parasiticus]|uniref:Uncharacterized protein n=1 Tax=Tieghemiomyces parasiticus TaxID=78921 RepID=A0A9W8AJP3_9FUNG|nr:hypothetical protein IWQ60_000021 [Tieghemiomyces parasiticus]
MPPKKRGNYRKRPATDEIESTETPTAAIAESSVQVATAVAETPVSIEDLIELRKFRRRHAGVSADALAKAPKKCAGRKARTGRLGTGLLNETEAAESDDNGGDSDEEPSKAKNILGTFTSQTDIVDVDKHMMNYIETEMKKMKGEATPADDDQEIARTSPSNPMDNLYQVPDHLRIKAKPVKEGNALISSAMLTSVPEVQLSIESKMKNMEATAIAKRQLQDGKAMAPGQETIRNHRFLLYQKSNRHGNASDAIAREDFIKRVKR